MTRVATITLTSVLLLSAGGCDALLGVLPPRVTSVRLVNNSDFSVSVVIFISDEQDIPEDLLTQEDIGTRLDFTLLPGESTSFSRDCDDLQAIIIDDADLLVIGQIGPEARTDVFRDGSDFGCGDTISFTFDHSAFLTDFHISTSVQ